MHLCRGNCLSQVLPGTFIVSPDTEYSAPLSWLGAGGAVIMSAPGLLQGRGGRWAGEGGPDLGCVGSGGQGAWLPTPADSSEAHLGMGILGSQGQGFVLNPWTWPRGDNHIFSLVQTVTSAPVSVKPGCQPRLCGQHHIKCLCLPYPTDGLPSEPLTLTWAFFHPTQSDPGKCRPWLWWASCLCWGILGKGRPCLVQPLYP